MDILLMSVRTRSALVAVVLVASPAACARAVTGADSAPDIAAAVDGGEPSADAPTDAGVPPADAWDIDACAGNAATPACTCPHLAANGQDIAQYITTRGPVTITAGRATTSGAVSTRTRTDLTADDPVCYVEYSGQFLAPDWQLQPTVSFHRL